MRKFIVICHAPESGSSPGDKEVIGYSILQAEDMEGSKELLAGPPYPGRAEDCTIEVHESLPLPGLSVSLTIEFR